MAAGGMGGGGRLCVFLSACPPAVTAKHWSSLQSPSLHAVCLRTLCGRRRTPFRGTRTHVGQQLNFRADSCGGRRAASLLDDLQGAAAADAGCLRVAQNVQVVMYWTHHHKAPPHAPTRHPTPRTHAPPLCTGPPLRERARTTRGPGRCGKQRGVDPSARIVAGNCRALFAGALLGLACVRRTNVRYFAHVQHCSKPRGQLAWSAMAQHTEDWLPVNDSQRAQ